MIYASWNGATQVTAWRVLAGAGSGSAQPVTTAAGTGFETVIPVQSASGQLEVQALGANGKVLGTSRPVSAG